MTKDFNTNIRVYHCLLSYFFQNNEYVNFEGFSESEVLHFKKNYPNYNFSCGTGNFISIKNNPRFNKHDKYEEHTSFICTSGKSLNNWKIHLESHFRSVTIFGLLPYNNPKIIIPLTSRFSIKLGLNLHKPGRLKARFAIKIGEILSFFGNLSLLKKNILIVATNNSSVDRCIVDSKIKSLSALLTHNFVFYLGNSPNCEKLIALSAYQKCQNYIFKITKNESNIALENEANTISILSSSKIHNYIPKLISKYSISKKNIYQYSFRQRVFSFQYDIFNNSLFFLTELSYQERRCIPFGEIIKNYDPCKFSFHSSELSILCNKLYQLLLFTSPFDLEIVFHRVHGDYAPWNFSSTDSGFFVYDWEDSMCQGLALTDAIYMQFSKYYHIDNTYKCFAFYKIKKFCLKLSLNANIKGNIYIYISLWFLNFAKKVNKNNEFLIYFGRKLYNNLNESTNFSIRM